MRTGGAESQDGVVAHSRNTEVAVFNMFGGEREVGGLTSILIAHHPAVTFPPVLFLVSDVYTIFQSLVSHFSAFLPFLHLPVPRYLLVPSHIPVPPYLPVVMHFLFLSRIPPVGSCHDDIEEFSFINVSTN